MFGISDAHHFRKMVAGFCMVFGPLCVLIGFVADGSTAQGFLFAGAILMLPAALGLMHMLREREVAFGHLGGGLSMAGLMGMAALIGMGGNGSADLVDRVHHVSGVTTWMFVVAMGLGAGLALLGLGVFRAHATASWAAACLMVGGVALDVALIAGSGGVAIAATAALFAGLGGTGLMVWRESDEAWEQTPALGGIG